MQPTSILPITIWMNTPSFYQEDLFWALINTGEVDLQVIYAYGLPVERQQLGWQVALDGYSHIFLQDKRSAKTRDLYNAIRLALLQRDRFHVVNGLWAEPTFSLALLALTLAKSDFAVYSEASRPLTSRYWIKSAFRAAFSRLALRNARGVLPVGTLGVDFFRSLGTPEHKIYPFGYFRQAVTQLDCRNVENCDELRLVFVGQLIERKGLDTLLKAVAALVSEEKVNIQLTLIGEGPQRYIYEQQTIELDLQENVSFAGAVSSDNVLKHICRSDALILPSLWDGWGLVVNEALSVGTPVIVSDACGAAELIFDGINGYVFRASNVDSLKQKITKLLESRTSWLTMRLNAKSIGQRISTEVMAKYLLTCIRHMNGQIQLKPQLPWLAMTDVKS